MLVSFGSEEHASAAVTFSTTTFSVAVVADENVLRGDDFTLHADNMVVWALSLATDRTERAFYDMHVDVDMFKL